MIGLLSEEEVEAQTDEILRLHQGHNSLIATIQHESDGWAPTTVFSITDNNEYVRRLPASQWD
jgi:hypothetical protein